MAIDLDRLSLWLEILIKLAGLVLTITLIFVNVFFKGLGYYVGPMDYIISVSMMGVRADWLLALRGKSDNGKR